jgi:hypothetical protein
METLLFFYTGVGIAVASTLRSGTATFMLLSGSILGLMFYSRKIFPHINWFQVIIKGVSYLPAGKIGFGMLATEAAILIVLSCCSVFLGYFILRFKNLRSGKNA